MRAVKANKRLNQGKQIHPMMAAAEKRMSRARGKASRLICGKQMFSRFAAEQASDKRKANMKCPRCGYEIESNKTITLTYAKLHAGGSARCGFNKPQLALLGVAWPPQKGWLTALIGKQIPLALYEQFVALKGATIKP